MAAKKAVAKPRTRMHKNNAFWLWALLPNYQGPNRITVPIFSVLLLQILQLPVQEATLPGAHEQPVVPLLGVVQIVSVLGFPRLRLASNSCTSSSACARESLATGALPIAGGLPTCFAPLPFSLAKIYYRKSATWLLPPSVQPPYISCPQKVWQNKHQCFFSKIETVGSTRWERAAAAKTASDLPQQLAIGPLRLTPLSFRKYCNAFAM